MGRQFHAYDDDLGSLNVYCLDFDPFGRLLAGTADGVFIFGWANIPTLTEWGMLLLGLLLLATGTVAVVRRRRYRQVAGADCNSGRRTSSSADIPVGARGRTPTTHFLIGGYFKSRIKPRLESPGY